MSVRKTIVCIALGAAVTLLAACGGGSGGGGGTGATVEAGGDGGGGGGSGAQGGAVATVDTAPIPGYQDGDNVLPIGASNNGFYMQVNAADDTSRVVKVHGNPFFNDWSTAAPSGFVNSIAIANVYTERDREFGFYYAGTDDSLTRFWGSYTANTGGVSYETEDDFGVHMVAAGGTSGIAATRPWVIAAGMRFPNNDEQYVYQDDGQYTANNPAVSSDHFSTRADNTSLVGGVDAMLAHPTDGTLFVGYRNELRTYSSSKLLTREQLPAGLTGSIGDMVWVDNTLWFSHGDRFYQRTAPGSFREVARLSNGAGAMLAGRFCMKSGEVFGADGTATRVTDGRTRNYIYKGSLTPQQQASGPVLAATLSSGVFCNPHGAAEAGGIVTIYALPSPLEPGRVRMIRTVGPD